MRGVDDAARVRLYHLDDGGGARTIAYASLAEAIALARAQPEAVQAGLYLQTDSDVIAWSGFSEG